MDFKKEVSERMARAALETLKDIKNFSGQRKPQALSMDQWRQGVIVN